MKRSVSCLCFFLSLTVFPYIWIPCPYEPSHRSKTGIFLIDYWLPYESCLRVKFILPVSRYLIFLLSILYGTRYTFGELTVYYMLNFPFYMLPVDTMHSIYTGFG